MTNQNGNDEMEIQEQPNEIEDKHILVQFKNENGETLGSSFDMPINLSKEKLQLLCDALLQKVSNGHGH